MVSPVVAFMRMTLLEQDGMNQDSTRTGDQMAAPKATEEKQLNAFDRLHARLIFGKQNPRSSARVRHMYAAVRELFNASALHERKRLARVQDVDPALVIPRDEGMLVVPPGTFAEVDDVVTAARDHFARMDIDAVIKNNSRNPDRTLKPHLLHSELSGDELFWDSPLFKLGLRPELLAAFSQYLQMVPVLHHVHYWYSRYVPSDDLMSSQKFHMDWDDTSMLRMWVVVNDITADNGPTVVLNAKRSEEVRQRLLAKGLHWVRVTDEEFFAEVKEEELVPLTVPAGSLIIADTCRCFHYGSRMPEGSEPRLLTSYWYARPSAFRFPIRFNWTPRYAHLPGEEALSPMQELALGRR